MRHLQSYRYIDAIAKAGSIRGAAETLAITPSALNRRVLALEEELGEAIFERLSRGVRLSAAGELLIHYIRTQLSDMDRLRSQIADLKGVRRGHVSIACSQALLPYFLPREVARYRRNHPGVTFSVHLRDRAAAEQALADHSADIALVFEPIRMYDFQTVAVARQPLLGIMACDHPLAGVDRLRLYECLQYPIALPTAAYGVRHLLETACRRLALGKLRLEPVVESDSFEFLRHYVANENLISFQIPLGLAQVHSHNGVVTRPVDIRDVPEGLLYMGQLGSRALPVAAARFADQLIRVLEDGDF